MPYRETCHIVGTILGTALLGMLIMGAIIPGVMLGPFRPYRTKDGFQPAAATLTKTTLLWFFSFAAWVSITAVIVLAWLMKHE